jgi:hypothetical protein
MYQQALKLYDSAVPRQQADGKQLNILVLERLGKALNTWKDTSIKKVDRLQELKNADDICAAFKQLMRPNMPSGEREILIKVFAGIQDKIKKAVAGEVVDFSDAANAINFIVNCMKE